MSADNGYVVRENAANKFVLQMYFASDDTYPSIDAPGVLRFDTLQEAVDFYGQHLEDYPSEYGLTIDVKFQEGRLYPLLKEYCPYCGPGYHIGDDGCRHTNQKETKMQLQQFTRKPLVVEGVQVTDTNILEVAGWCSGEIFNEPKGRYIKVEVQKPMSERQTKAFIGDWVLSSNRGFKVYTSAGLQNAFDQNVIDPATEPMFHPEASLTGKATTSSGGGNIFDAPQELLTTDRPVNPSDQISGKQ